MRERKTNVKILYMITIFLISSFYTHADDVQSVPLIPKGKTIEGNQIGLSAVNEPPMKLLSSDPIVVKQIQKTKHLQKASDKRVINSSVKSSSSLNDELQIIDLPVSDVSQRVVNNSPYFVYEDVTVRGNDDQKSSQTLLTPEMRRLQVEAVRQGAAKKKNL